MKRTTAWLLIAGLLLPNASSIQAAGLDTIQPALAQEQTENNEETQNNSTVSEEKTDIENQEEEQESGNKTENPEKVTDPESTESTEKIEETVTETTEQPEEAVEAYALRTQSSDLDWLAGLVVPAGATGAIRFGIGNVLPLERDLIVTVKAEKDGVVKTKEVKIAKGSYTAETLIEGLEKGTYHVTMQAEGFALFEQEIAVDGDVKSVQIDTGKTVLDGVVYEPGSAHPGLLLIGDADGDGQITEQDKDVILDAASGKKVSGTTDFNGDGKTDILDLQYYASALAEKQKGTDTKSAVTASIAPQAAAVQVNNGTTASGDPGTLLSGTQTVTLSNTAGTQITENDPVELGVVLQDQEKQEAGTGVPVEQIVIHTGASGIESGEVVVETEDGTQTYPIGAGTPAVALFAFGAAQQKTADDTCVIDLGGQVAVKRIVIRVTAATAGASLVDITKVEFLNGMESRIPEPEMDIPQKLSADGANKSFTLTWEKSRNVTGYEVEISHDGTTEVLRAASNTLKVSAFGGEELVNREVYKVRVQAVNGTWRSGYGETVDAVPKIEARPDAPDYLKAAGAYRRIRMSWKDMDDTDSYCVYYREKGTGSYTKVDGIKTNSYEITGLSDKTVYEVYVTGVNELGESDPSLVSEAETTVIVPAELPEYKMINEPGGQGELTSHIVSASHPRGEMVNSLLDRDGTDSALGLVDNDYSSYYHVADWDEGGVYPADSKGIYFNFDQKYEMNYITFAEPEDVASFSGASLYYYEDDHKTNHAAKIAGVLQKTDENGRKYYAVKLSEPVTTDMVRIGFTRYGAYRDITIAEVRFYHYDSLEDEVLALYADDLHTMLREGVTEADMDALQERLDTVDAKSGEYHPERESIQKELDNARGLLDASLGDTLEISPQITAAKDGHLGFGGLNAWQPLGVSAASGEQVTIYVGHDSKKTGESTPLKLIATQYHAESGSVKTEVASLKVGRNELTIPKLQSLAAEAGGALYVAYTGNNDDDRYAVRVSGGTKIPVLNLYGVTDETERLDKVTDYVEQLEKQIEELEHLHEAHHAQAADGTGAKRDFDNTNCIAGATDIMLDKMMYSVSAEQIYKALGSGSRKEKAQKLNESLKAMDQTMELFYHHKGLTDEAGAKASDRMPSQHLNIRYMRMFAGAFMYAAGDHIGIEWGSVGGLATAVPIVSENGKYVSGNLFGWGIAHEIGHNINQSVYSVAEVTNNYFAQLTTSRDTNESARWKYPDLYEKVTSGTKGASANGAVQLAMYWQLHLAYDRDYNFKMYDTHEEQMENLFYARVDAYARDTASAPAPGGVALVLDGDKDQIFMRLACAAAEADITEYFIRWGMEPDAGTKAYAGQFDKEERAIYYTSDDARVYEIGHGTGASFKDKDVVAAESSVTGSDSVPNEVMLAIKGTMDAEVLLGYEVTRVTLENGKKVREVAGFVTPEEGTTQAEWKDHVATINNRVVAYEVQAVDKFGYRSQAEEIGSVRIAHDGSLDKSMWDVTTNMTSDADSRVDATEKDPCEPEEKPAVAKVIDNDYSSETYTGRSETEDAVITIDLKKQTAVSALKLTKTEGNGIDDYRIEVRSENGAWTTVKEGTFADKNGSQTVYFENEAKDPWVATYDVSQVRLTAKDSAGEDISVTEIDLLGPSGDSVSFGTVEGDTDTAVGILESAYEYEEGSSIPAGSLVFMGRYKGNPAYNVLLLYDMDGNIIGETAEDGSVNAEQIILAKVPENGALGEVSDGTWIYWIAPDENGNVPSFTGSIRAELYRVDNALTNEGQRLVSDTQPFELPENIGNIKFKD